MHISAVKKHIYTQQTQRKDPMLCIGATGEPKKKNPVRFRGLKFFKPLRLKFFFPTLG